MGRHARENHRNFVAGVTVARASDNDARAFEFLGFQRGFQRDGHLCPCWDLAAAMELDAVFADANCGRWQGELSSGSLDCYRLAKLSTGNFSCAHIVPGLP